MFIGERETIFPTKRQFVAAGVLTLTVPVGFALARGQTTAANGPPKSGNTRKALAFDVVSIKPTPPSYDKTLMQHFPDGTSFLGAPVRMVMQSAFAVNDDRILSAPSWVNTSRYDIEAKVSPEDASNFDKLKDQERRAMILSMLNERFHLIYHHETRERSTYALVVARGGPKMAEGESFPPGGVPPGGVKPPDGQPADRAPEHYKMMPVPGHLEADSIPMYLFADTLSRLLRCTVIDKTGLTANYNFTLRWTPDSPLPPALNSYSPGSLESGLADTGAVTDGTQLSIFTAIQEQLGLKVESKKESVDVIVIDHIDPPSPN